MVSISIHSVSLPPDDENIEIIREFAREQGFFLWRARNSTDLWDLRDMQTRKVVLAHQPLAFIHDYLCHNLE